MEVSPSRSLGSFEPFAWRMNVRRMPSAPPNRPASNTTLSRGDAWPDWDASVAVQSSWANTNAAKSTSWESSTSRSRVDRPGLNVVVQGSTSAISSSPRVIAWSSLACLPDDPRKMRGLVIRSRPPDERYPVADAQKNLHRAGIRGDVVVEGDDLGRTVDHAAVRKGVVRDDQAPLGQARQHGLVVADVALLLGVDEDDVEVALEPLHRLERRADMEGDLRPVRRAVEVALREGSARRIELAGVDVAAPRERGGHGERRVAAERADLEHPRRLRHPDQELEQAPGDGAGQHARRAELLRRLRRKLGKERLVGRRQPFDVFLDARVDDVHVVRLTTDAHPNRGDTLLCPA